MNRPQLARAGQFDALQRMAAFGAKVRGHQLTGWKAARHSAKAACVACGRTVTVYRSLVQPEIEGDALENECENSRCHAAA